MSLTANVVLAFQPRGAPQVRRIPRRRPPGASGDATLRWGEPSDFQFSSRGGTRISIIQPTFTDLPQGDDDDIAADGLIFTETERETTTVRITNPQDANDFVDVERIDRISFLGPDGVIRTFVLNN